MWRMKKEVVIIMCSIFSLLTISLGQDIDTYKMMEDILKKPNEIETLISDTVKLNHQFILLLKDTNNLNFLKNYLIKNFNAYSYIGLDTICSITKNGKLIGYHHYIKYYNEIGNTFCFWFVKKVDGNWMLRAFGDYEVWYPRTKCPDDE